MKVVSSANIQSEIREHLKNTYQTIDFAFYKNIREAEQDLENADVLVTYGEDLTEDEIEKAKNLKWLMVISAGIEKLPFAALKRQHVLVTNARGIHKIPMAEYTIGVLLQTAKKMNQWYENQKKHHWDRRIKMDEVSGKVMAIVGTGAIGGEIARLAKAFNMTTLGINRSGKKGNFIDEQFMNNELESVLPRADFVISILPSTTETYHFFTKEQFLLMKEEAVFVNIGRGNTVDEKGLLEALQENQIAHAVLDVFEKEPIDVDHPFWDMSNVTISPHFSAISDQYQKRAMVIFEENLQTFINKGLDYVNEIDLNRGY